MSDTEQSPRGSDKEVDLTIRLEPYSEKSLRVVADYNTYAKKFKKFHTRWNSRLKQGPGWLLPIEFESAFRSNFDVEDNRSPRYSRVSKNDVGKNVRHSDRNTDRDRSERNSERDRSERDSERVERNRSERDSDRVERNRSERGQVERHSDEKLEREELSQANASSVSQSRQSVRTIVNDLPQKLVSKLSVVSAVHQDFNPDEQDIISLSRKMKEIMNRLDQIEKKK